MTALSASISVNDGNHALQQRAARQFMMFPLYCKGNNLCPCRRKWQRKINAIQKASWA